VLELISSRSTADTMRQGRHSFQNAVGMPSTTVAAKRGRGPNCTHFHYQPITVPASISGKAHRANLRTDQCNRENLKTKAGATR
jgi:hypothetical protein